MALTPEDAKLLNSAFPRAAHEFVNGFVYIAEQAVTERIDAVDPSWRFELLRIEHVYDQCIVHARLTIKDVSREGVGMQKVVEKAGEPAKGAATDALKRAARLFGVGRYLLDNPPKEGAAFDKWLSEQQKALNVQTTPQPQQNASTGFVVREKAIVPNGDRSTSIPPTPSTPSTADAYAEPDPTPDADGFRRYLVHEVVVIEMPNGGRQYVAKSEAGVNIVTYGGDKFSDVGYDTSMWHANGRTNLLKPACIVEARYDAEKQKWLIRSVEEAL